MSGPGVVGLRRLRFTPIVLLALAGALACSSSGGEDDGTAGGPSVDGGANLGSGDADDPSRSDGGTASTDQDGAPPSGEGVVAQHGRLAVSGNKVVDATGKPFAVHGMSLFWSQWGSKFWNTSVIKTLKNDWSSTVVRAAMAVEEGGYLTNPAAEKARVKAVVDAAIAEGIYVIIDWHDHNAHQHVEPSKAFFKEMAETYGGTPNVMFEIFNEPTADIQWPTVKAYAEQIIPVIRGAGSTNLILVGSPHWDQDVDVAAASPLADSNVAYTYHFYAATHKQAIRDKGKSALDKGVALFATEWGTTEASGSGSVDLGETDTWLKFLEDNQISWCNWTVFDGDGDPDTTSNALRKGASETGPWSDDVLTRSGKYAKDRLTKR